MTDSGGMRTTTTVMIYDRTSDRDKDNNEGAGGIELDKYLDTGQTGSVLIFSQIVS